MKPARLLRWYPRAWRERYGEELLTLIQDTLDDGRPTWRLRLGVVRGGLRERAHQALQAGIAAVKRQEPNRLVTIIVAGGLVALLPGSFHGSSHAARGWQATAAFNAVLAAVALTGAVVLAAGLAALPALVRFLRAGGWPEIWRRIAWAAGATVVAGGGLAGLVLVSGSRSPAQLGTSWGYEAGLLATGLATAVAIALWATAAATTARHLSLAPRVRAVQLMLGAVITPLFLVMFATLNFWWSVTKHPGWLIPALMLLGAAGLRAEMLIGPAVRKGRRLRAAARGETIVNPSAQRTHGRRRA